MRRAFLISNAIDISFYLNICPNKTSLGIHRDKKKNRRIRTKNMLRRRTDYNRSLSTQKCLTAPINILVHGLQKENVQWGVAVECH